MIDEFELANYTQWCNRIPGYYAMCRNQKKNAKKRWRSRMSYAISPIKDFGLKVPQTDFDAVKEVCCATPTAYYFPKDCCEASNITATEITNRRRKSAMQSTANLQLNASVNTEADVRFNERMYLEIRLSQVYGEKKDKLRKTYGLSDQNAPRSPKELVERIKSGMFVLPTDWAEDDECTPQWYMSRIRWRDPSLTEDKDGYKVAALQLRTEYDKVLDSIKIKDPTEALPELQAWEAVT